MPHATRMNGKYIVSSPPLAINSGEGMEDQGQDERESSIWQGGQFRL